MKRLGVGTYRLVAGNVEHEQVVTRALCDLGFTVIDTSPNYNDSLSETLVGEALKKVPEDRRKEVEIVSKFGFIQGRTLEEHLNKPFPNAIKYTEDCSHCIDGEFMRHELTGSLARLGVEKLDTYLVHNPEHFLMGKIPPNITIENGAGMIEEFREQLLENLENTFVALEEQVQDGKIGQYGISCNSFALPNDHPHFLPFQNLVEMATKAAAKAGSENHSLRVFQMPGNIIERIGLTPMKAGGNGCIEYAHKHGIDVTINRALTGFDDVGSWRLAESEFPSDYPSHRDDIVSHLTPPVQDMSSWSDDERAEWEDTLRACAWLVGLINDLDAQMGSFTSVMHYQEDLMRKIIPMINAKLDGMDDDTKAKLYHFFNSYEQAVRSVAGQQTRTHVFESISQDEALQNCKDFDSDVFVAPRVPPLMPNPSDDNLQTHSLRWLCDHPAISTILVGTTKMSYAEEASKIFLK